MRQPLRKARSNIVQLVDDKPGRMHPARVTPGA